MSPSYRSSCEFTTALLLAWLFTLAMVTPVVFSGQPPLPDAKLDRAALDEAVKSWATSSAFIWRSQGSAAERLHHNTQAGERPRADRSRKLEYYLDGPSGSVYCKLFGSEVGKGSTVVASTPNYSFELTRSRNDIPYAITQYAPTGKDEVLADRRVGILLQYVFAEEYLNDKSLITFLNGSSGKVNSTQWDLTTGKRLFRIDVVETFKHSDIVCPGWAVLDPGKNWAVIKFGTTFADGSVTRATVTYQDAVKEAAYPLQLVEEELNAAGMVVDTMTIDFDAPKTAQFKPDQFKLEAFGLSEPEAPKLYVRPGGGD